MRILGIETSCDETGAAVIEGESKNKKVTLVSNVLASSLSFHSKTGGIIPETAAREQIKYIIPVIEQVLSESKSSKKKIVNRKSSIINLASIDAIAVTVGPGLIGSLLVGVETAKTLSYIYKIPIIPVNHLFGHIYANFIGKIHNSAADVQFPAIALIVSGGHTDLVLIENHQKIKWLGGTRDDAAGEAFDKIGRLLNLSYPGGPSIEKAAKAGNPKTFRFPRPLINSNDFDFSFSGLKTAVFREVQTMKSPQMRDPVAAGQLSNETISDISASVQEAIVDVLIYKTLKAAQKYKVKSILLGGGVAANQKLRDELKLKIENSPASTSEAGRAKLKIQFFVPEKWLCTDNAAMIASAAFYNYKPVPWNKITANPELYFY